MIQRIQTIYLLCSVIFAFLLQFFPLWRTDALLITFTYIIGVIGFISIFLFKNRLLQMLVCKINFFFIIILLFGSYFRMQSQKVGFIENNAWMGFFLLILVIGFTYLAYRAIKKDEILVREAERIR